MFKSITFGSLEFPFSEDFSGGLVEEEPGVLRFYLFGPRVESASDDEDAGVFADSRCSSTDSFEDAFPPTAYSHLSSPPPCPPARDRHEPGKPSVATYNSCTSRDVASARPAQRHSPRSADEAKHSTRRCLLRRCYGRPPHAQGTCFYRKRVCERCGEGGHGQERCSLATSAAPREASHSGDEQTRNEEL